MFMTSSPALFGPLLPPLAGGPPRQIVVLLHGLGADGQDLIGLGQTWRLLLPGALFIAPNAPQPCDMAPFGHQWFSLQERTGPALIAGVRSAAPMVDAFLDGLLDQHQLLPAKLALVGFSQGTMTALHVALRRKAALAGVVGYSGVLIGEPVLAAEIRSRPPVLLIHGDQDQVLPHRALGEAEAALTRAGVTVTAVTRPGLGHGIDPEGVEMAGAFLKARLDP